MQMIFFQVLGKVLSEARVRANQHANVTSWDCYLVAQGANGYPMASLGCCPCERLLTLSRQYSSLVQRGSHKLTHLLATLLV